MVSLYMTREQKQYKSLIMADYKLAIQYYDSKMRSSIRKEKEIDNKGYSLVELIVVIAIMAVMVGVMSLGLGMMFTRDANYVAVRIDDMLTEARTASMSRAGTFTYSFHIDGSSPSNSYVKIDQTTDTGTTEYKRILLDKRVTVKVNGSEANDFSVVFDKAKGNVKTAEIDGTARSDLVYEIDVTSKKNTSKTNKVTLVTTTGRHYTEK